MKYGKNAIGPLIEALANPSEKIKANAVELLEEMTGQKFGTNQTQWQEWHKTQ